MVHLQPKPISVLSSKRGEPGEYLSLILSPSHCHLHPLVKALGSPVLRALTKDSRVQDMCPLLLVRAQKPQLAAE